MPGPQAGTAWLQASERGAELAEVWSCRAEVSSLAGFKGRCPLPSGAPLTEWGAVGQVAPRRCGVPTGAAHGESAKQRGETHHYPGPVTHPDQIFKAKAGVRRIASQHCRNGAPANTIAEHRLLTLNQRDDNKVARQSPRKGDSRTRTKSRRAEGERTF